MAGGVTLPRDVLPGQFVLLNRRCAQREFLLRPDDEANQTFLYCLAVAAEKYGIEVIIAIAMSDHHHTGLYDRHGRRVEFYGYFHMLLARSMNALRRRSEGFWSTDPPCVVELVDRAAVVEKVVYAATNPVNAGLVERASEWPGVNTLAALLGEREITVRRPTHFFSEDGELPEVVTLKMVVPPELGDAAAFRAEVAARVAEVEDAAARARARTGAAVLGPAGVLAQPTTQRAVTPEVRGRLRPRFATRDAAAARAVIARWTAFLAGYRAARERWLAGAAAVFPAGTYWLQRFANVTVAPLPAVAPLAIS